MSTDNELLSAVKVTLIEKANLEKRVKELEEKHTRLSKMLEMAIDFIEQEDMQCKLCSFFSSCRENCPYGDETPISDIIRAELEKRVMQRKGE
ncbi:MAG: hypothetical protein MJZ37_00320 [Bacilli bacterium]|nr:hypothetical protein [Bacilli bacterium]